MRRLKIRAADYASLIRPTGYLQSVDTPPAKAKAGAKKAQAGKAQPKDAAKGATTSAPVSRLPTGTISEDPRVKPPAKIPGK